MGGQGGGVLIDWLIALGEAAGWAVQATSVAGVAQRTGATLYYLEWMPPPPEGWQGRRPVLALMPTPGDVDIVVGAELMEAGRAMQRGLVTPDRTTLIVSTHRALAVAEKMAPGDAQGDPSKVLAAAAVAARYVVGFDMQSLAEEARSAISAVLLGALAGSRALPFSRADFEATIRAKGVGVEGSLRAFALGYERAAQGAAAPALPRPSTREPRLPPLARIGWTPFDRLVERAHAAFPESTHGMIAAGLRRVVDFQDAAYGAEYLDRLASILTLDRTFGGEDRGWRLTATAAKHMARAMAYDDVIRVADLKTRRSRFERVRHELEAGDDQIIATTEYMHPRIEELAGLLPLHLGLGLERPGWLQGLVRPFLERGRRVTTTRLRWFLPLYALAGLRWTRRASLRHAREQAHLQLWLAQVTRTAPADYALAVEILEARRLIKGYSDTHARGLGKLSGPGQLPCSSHPARKIDVHFLGPLGLYPGRRHRMRSASALLMSWLA